MPLTSTTAEMSDRSRDELQLVARYEQLLGWFRGFGQVLVAYSGGVDSTFVLRAACDAVGAERVTAVTADSPSLARTELDSTVSYARSLGVRHQLLQTTELDDPRYVANRGDRCFFCKQHLYDALFEQLPRIVAPFVAAGYVVVDGANIDDRSDDRPGARAAAAAGIRHPLDELGFTKLEIREHSRLLGLATWNKPAMACLASRLAPGVPVTTERLGKVELVEKLLADEGIAGARVRLHLFTAPDGEELSLARIELTEPERAMRHREKIVATARAAGFSFVTVDLEGYKRGGRPHATPPGHDSAVSPDQAGAAPRGTPSLQSMHPQSEDES